MNLKEHPGPFVESSGRARKAMWMNCAQCGNLFPRPLSTSRGVKGNQAREFYCSISCGRRATRKTYAVRCDECQQIFEVYAEAKTHKRPGPHFCPACVTMGKSKLRTSQLAKLRATYAAYHNLRGAEIPCEYCGELGAQVWRKDRSIKLYQIGNLEAICVRCSMKRNHGETLVPIIKERY